MRNYFYMSLNNRFIPLCALVLLVSVLLSTTGCMSAHTSMGSGKQPVQVDPYTGMAFVFV